MMDKAGNESRKSGSQRHEPGLLLDRTDHLSGIYSALMQLLSLFL